jgi:Rrf2 family protein
MLITPNKLNVLVEALLYIAHHSSMQPLGGKKLADILDVPPRYLELLLQSLVKATILRSIRGPRGGYMLARERRSIYMNEVVLAVGNEKPAKDDSRPSIAQKELVQPLFIYAHHAYLAALGEITLEDLCNKTQQMELTHLFALKKHEVPQRLDFSI